MSTTVDTWPALVARALALVGPGPAGRAVLGITGPPGAGKSTLADGLLGRLRHEPPVGLGADGVGHVPMDGFHLADVQLDRLGRRDRKGSPDTFDAAGYVATLRRLLEDPGTTTYVPGFERDLEQPVAAALAVEPAARLVLTEGNYLLLPDGGWEQARPLLAEVWWVDIDDEVRRRRLVQRHVRFGKAPAAAQEWVERSDEANAALVATTRAAADVVVPLDRLVSAAG